MNLYVRDMLRLSVDIEFDLFTHRSIAKKL
jgi:hypothetical protein